jgi:hypothetical protein
MIKMLVAMVEVIVVDMENDQLKEVKDKLN